MDIFDWLADWYKSCCNGDWEHSYGIEINTLDNPGWSVQINLENTTLEGKAFNKIKIDTSDKDWIFCYVENNRFKGASDLYKLKEIIKIFKIWAEE